MNNNPLTKALDSLLKMESGPVVQRPSEERHFGKDCPVGMVQVEFVGCSPANRMSDYGWRPEKRAFLELWVDGQRFRIEVGDVTMGDGTTRRGLHIFKPLDAEIQQQASNTCSILLPEGGQR